MPLSFRFVPPIGGPLYWLRPGTIRLPPWPGRVPLTAGSRRTAFDVALYAGVLASGVYLLAAPGVDAAGLAAGRLAPAGIAVLLGFLALLGLRDKVSFLGARPEIYATMLAVGLFPVSQWIVAWQFVFVFIWWGAASSKLNRHFPFVVSVMISNAPWSRSKSLKRKLWRDYPDDMRPSRLAANIAHFGTVQEFGWPLLLLTVDNNTVRTIAIAGMILFHVNITSMFPLAVPLEWNIFMIFGTLFLFGHYGDVPLSTLDDPLLIAMIAIACVGLPLLGNLRPDKVSFLPSMRYYAGNWATTQWLFRKGSGAEEKLDTRIEKPARIIVEQVGKIYDPEMAEFLLNKGLAFRAMHSHGRALNALLPHAVEDVEAYDAREGELISNIVNGWNFGDGHFHGRQLLEAVQERCGFEPGEVRVIALESEAAGSGRQRYAHLRRGDGPGGGGIGGGRRHGRAPAVARRVVGLPGRGDARALREPPRRSRARNVTVATGHSSPWRLARSRVVYERRDGRRLRPQRAGLRGGAGARGGAGHGARGAPRRSAGAPGPAS